MKKILIIHPDMLKPLWLNKKNDPNFTIVTNGRESKSSLRKLIKCHDHVIMLGHGTDEGLLRTPIRTYNLSNMVDSSFVQLLREKEWNVFIWCNADEFVKKYNLKGFTTGMIISEIAEAVYCSVVSNGASIDEANDRFVFALKEHLFNEPQILFDDFKKKFDVRNNNVCQFNGNNIYLF
jgi:hypothetical protein